MRGAPVPCLQTSANDEKRPFIEQPPTQIAHPPSQINMPNHTLIVKITGFSKAC
jgi:hypothetical protein